MIINDKNNAIAQGLQRLTADMISDAALVIHDDFFNPNQRSFARLRQCLPGENLKQLGRHMPNAHLIAAKPFSNHPGDRHLHTVLAVWWRDGFEFVQWTVNDGTQEEDGIAMAFWGHYFEDWSQALIEYKTKGHDAKTLAQLNAAGTLRMFPAQLEEFNTKKKADELTAEFERDDDAAPGIMYGVNAEGGQARMMNIEHLGFDYRLETCKRYTKAWLDEGLRVVITRENIGSEPYDANYEQDAWGIMITRERALNMLEELNPDADLDAFDSECWDVYNTGTKGTGTRIEAARIWAWLGY